MMSGEQMYKRSSKLILDPEEQDQLMDKLSKVYKDIFRQTILNPLKEFEIAEDSQILTCRYHPTNSYIAAGSQNGIINILLASKDFSATQLVDSQVLDVGVSCLRWRPNQNSEILKNSLIATYTNGKIIYWNVAARSILYKLEEKENHINSCDFTSDGTKFITGGSDCTLRLYDCSKMSQPAATFSAGEAYPQHKNRIFSIKCISDVNVFYSGGWDKIVLQWDIRTKKSTGFLYGPMTCGDSMDFKDNQLLTGSFREENPIELWDTRKLSKICNIEWIEYGKKSPKLELENHSSKVYSCCFDKKSDYIYASSFGKAYSEIRMYDTRKNYQCIDSYCQPNGIISMDHSQERNQICYGLETGSIGVMNIVN